MRTIMTTYRDKTHDTRMKTNDVWWQGRVHSDTSDGLVTCIAFQGLFLVFPTMDSCMCPHMEVRVDKASGAGVTESCKLPCRC